MWFKKNNLWKSTAIIPNLIWVIALCLIFFIWFLLLKNADFFQIKVEKPSSWETQTLDEQEVVNGKTDKNTITPIDIKDEDKINILVVGRWWGSHEAPNLTDTIILASINTKSKIISMLSIPRDIYIDYPGNEEDGKINWLYAIYNFKSGSKKVGMDMLKKQITQMTWEKIDYFANIDFNWFKEIIDTIGWVEITIPQHFVDDKYPDENWWYKTLVFRKWTWIFDGENALKYARSRHSTSDFDRSMRQQQIISAIKNKLTGSYFLTSPWKIKELYEVFVNYVYTDIKLSTVIKLAYTLNSPGEYTILSSNLNDSCFYWSESCQKWGFLYTPSREIFWGMSVLLVDGTNIEKLSNYSKLHTFTDLVFNYPEIFKENYTINIFNSLKVNHLAWSLSNDIIRYWFNIPEVNSIWNTKTPYEKSIIYYNNIPTDSITLKALREFFTWSIIEVWAPQYSTQGAKIEIIIWEDYLEDNSNPFTF